MLQDLLAPLKHGEKRFHMASLHVLALRLGKARQLAIAGDLVFEGEDYWIVIGHSSLVIGDVPLVAANDQ